MACRSGVPVLTAPDVQRLQGAFVSRYWSLVVALCLAPQAARAECLGGGCYDGLVLILLLAALAVIGAIVLLLVVLPRRWRRVLLWGMGALVAANLIVPKVSDALQTRHLKAMEALEIVGQLPVLGTRTPLIFAYDDSCEMTTCGAALLAMGEAGAFALPMSLAETLDLTGPLVLSDLPLQHWKRTSQYDGRPVVRVLNAAERKAAAEAIDYLVFTRPFYLSSTGPFDDALRSHATWRDLGENVTLRLAMAPLQKGSGTFAFQDLSFDLVDLWSLRQSLGAPLFLGRWHDPVNTVAGIDAIADALCPQAPEGWDCRDWLWY